jgi:hypothetical protein
MSGFDTITGWAGQEHHILTIRRPIQRNVACQGESKIIIILNSR